LTGPRLTLGIGALSVAAFAAASLAHPDFGDDVGWRLLAVHSLDIAARAGLAVVVAVLLTRRSERIRELADSRRSLVTQALAAEHVELTVERAGDRIELRCRDDGRGIDPEARAAALGDGHLGLAACTERVEALGGSLEILSVPGGGTEVRASIPDGRRAVNVT